MRINLREHWATSAVVALFVLMTAYRAVLYTYPEPGSRRNPAEYVWDVLGYSYHYASLAFDATPTGLRTDYHARMALRYKPGDTFMPRYVQQGSRLK